MKNLVFAVAVALAGALAAEVNIASVDMMDLVSLHPRHEADAKMLRDTESRYQKELDAIRAEIEACATTCRDIQTEAQNPMLAAKAKEDAVKRFDEAQQKGMAAQAAYRDKAQGFQRELSELEAGFMRAITESIREAAKKVAAEKGYDFVLDRAAVPFATEKSDVTDEVLKALGVDPAKARAERDAKRAGADAKKDAAPAADKEAK